MLNVFELARCFIRKNWSKDYNQYLNFSLDFSFVHEDVLKIHKKAVNQNI
jgi:hypothetical protein